MVAFGAIQDKPDHRDFVASAMFNDDLPSAHSLFEYCTPVRSQLITNSCTGHAVVAAAELMRKLQRKTFDVEGSELFNYYNSRVIGGFFPNDCGAYLRDAVKAAQKFGDCPEKLFPFTIEGVSEKPGFLCAPFARLFTIGMYSRVLDLETMKANIYHGRPVIFAIPVYSSFITTGQVVTMPTPSESLRGYHAMLLIGYDDSSKTFTLKNSWGTDFGVQGYSQIPYAYFETYDFDAWVISL